MPNPFLYIKQFYFKQFSLNVKNISISSYSVFVTKLNVFKYCLDIKE